MTGPRGDESREFTDIWAKSPDADGPSGVGESLTVHSDTTLGAAVAVADRVGRLRGVPDWFWHAVVLAALLHDFGKIDPGFQLQVRHPGSKKYAWRQRHEVLSLGAVGVLLPERSELRLWVAAAVATHHRPLINQHKPEREILEPHLAEEGEPLEGRFTVTDDRDVLRALLRWFAGRAAVHGLLHEVPDLAAVTAGDVLAAVGELLAELDTRWGLYPSTAQAPAAASPGLPLVLLQGAVTLADHVASAHGELLTTHPVDAFTTTFLRSLTAGADIVDGQRVLHTHQQHARAAKRAHLLLRAPTGSGKTEAGTMWAEEAVRQIAQLRGGRPRLLYVLPYLASINAMSDRFRAVCPGEVGVLHSKAGVYHLHRLGEDVDDAPARALEAVDATRLHRQLMRVTTPYQLLRAAFAGVTDSATLLDSANSVFLFDELHAYEPRRLGMILAMMRLWSHDLGGRIGVLSATLPDRFAGLLEDTLGHDTVEEIDGFATTTAPPRHRLKLGDEHLTSPNTFERIADDLQDGHAVLVVANNIADAITIYEQLRDLAPARDEAGIPAAWLLHARFENGDRARVETEITKWFASTGAAPRPGLLVATQAAEVSLDVDLTVLHTSGATIEALLQRFGRINRRGLRPPASVWVYEPDYRTARGNQVRADGVYDPEPTRNTWELLSAHGDGGVLDESETQAWLNKLYTSDWGDTWEKQVRDFRDEFTRAFLTYTEPFTDRSHLKTQFFAQFDGFEAIRRDRVDDYLHKLRQGKTGEGRLLASSFHIPLPDHCRRHAEFSKDLGIHVIDGVYDQTTGLTEILGTTDYQPGEIL
ncbi:CRISPR-associated helicase/endonuclease Cas3 [Saccharopolyspora spinosa]|uniref:CRISPR-associated Cas3 family helicase n=1 Tax=Saccharopolyspora spinosa TaxID=60894 RepID=A0A2N3Y7C9_SACSN|nr:CRISPR-associated helicase/endonuclease Cas3 [Saccharopolyspora spinosa]PKW18793.1 CRISPR-associated Cas3 family helicase [Saccharopolyspora spinosa]